MKKLLAIAALALIIFGVTAQNTTRKQLRNSRRADISAVVPVKSYSDTIVNPDRSEFSVNGFDKPLRSRRETFFTTNNTGRPVDALAFTITYFDSNKRQLHQAKHRLDLVIPDTETRQVSVRSWDVQNSFYYVRSAKPDRAAGSPFDVTITIDTLFVK